MKTKCPECKEVAAVWDPNPDTKTTSRCEACGATWVDFVIRHDNAEQKARWDALLSGRTPHAGATV